MLRTSEGHGLRDTAGRVQRHFAREREALLPRLSEAPAPAPDADAIETLLDVAFWASLRKEEGRSPKISIAWAPPPSGSRSLNFERPLSLRPEVLARLAPAVERPGIHLGVWREGDTYSVWGATRAIPPLCFVLEVVEPGLLVVKYRRAEEFRKFANVAVLQGDEIKILAEDGGSSFHAVSPAASVLCGGMAGGVDPGANLLEQLAVSMRAHGRGGALLVVPHGTQRWRESIVHPISYAVSPAFARIAELLGAQEPERGSAAWQEALRQAVEGVAGLTAVDGATLITDRYELLAFGAKIGRRAGGDPVEQVIVTEPVVGATGRLVRPSELGGTRHLSAAQFVQDQPDATALVASQDGRFTVFAWSAAEGRVHAHRTEISLL